MVHGLNITIWNPVENVDSTVTGLSLGLPLTGGGVVRGLALGAGISASQRLDGVALGLLGTGSGGPMRGLLIGGLGAGCGGDVTGIALGGLGIGAGGDLTGIMIGGLGAGSGGNVTGLALGVLGVGAGGDLRGIFIGGLGAGAGGNVNGLAIGGLGVGAGGTIRGVALGVLGVGAPRIEGLAVGLAAGGQDVIGLVLAPAYFSVEPQGHFQGLSISAFNRIQGVQRGVVIGIFNSATELHGVQVGVLNWAGNNSSGLKLLPVVNAHFD